MARRRRGGHRIAVAFYDESGARLRVPEFASMVVDLLPAITVTKR